MGSACDGRRWNCARGTREEDFAAGLRSHLRLFPNPGKTAAMSIFGFVLVFGGISSASSNGKGGSSFTQRETRTYGAGRGRRGTVRTRLSQHRPLPNQGRLCQQLLALLLAFERLLSF
nr:uncharacterized protein LOC110362310 isoform X13 [Columba livia]